MDDIEEIRKLKARYFRCIDTKDWTGWRAVFTDDATMLVDGGVSTNGGDPDTAPEVRGGDVIRDHVRALIDPCVTVHHGHMPEIDLTSPDTAKGIWAMEDIVEWADGRRLHGHGHYHETYRRTADGWRIATLHLTRIRITFDQAGSARSGVL